MTSQTLTEKVLSDHLVGGELTPGESIDLDIDQVLLQDILGPLVWMEFEALEFETVETDVAVTYCDHQVYQFDSADTDTHRYLRTASQAYGGHFSKPGNGICHQVHRERFIEPGATLLGSDSHSTTMGGFGAIGIGAGGLDVATAMGGGAYTVEMPEIVEVHLTGELGEWTSAKDVILEMLRRHSVKGGVGKLFEFTGPGVETLSVPERCTITNMTTELGATTAIFPSDERTRRHLKRLGREDAYRELSADADATYDDRLEVDLSEIEPLVDALVREGYSVRYYTDGDLATALEGADAFLVIDPGSEYLPGDIDDVRQFTGNGGRLVMVGEPDRTAVSAGLLGTSIQTQESRLTTLASRYRMSVDTEYLYNQENADGTFKHLLVRPTSDSELAGVERAAMYTAAAVTAQNGTVLLRSAPSTHKSGSDEVTGEYPVAVQRNNVLLLGDKTFMRGDRYRVADNEQLVAYLAEFMIEGNYEAPPDRGDGVDAGDELESPNETATPTPIA